MFRPLWKWLKLKFKKKKQVGNISEDGQKRILFFWPSYVRLGTYIVLTEGKAIFICRIQALWEPPHGTLCPFLPWAFFNSDACHSELKFLQKEKKKLKFHTRKKNKLWNQFFSPKKQIKLLSYLLLSQIIYILNCTFLKF